MERPILKLALLLAWLVAGSACIKSGAFVCATDLDCGAGGQCEANGFCSFADADCGRRFGADSGPVSNQCVDEVPGVDAPIGDGPVTDAPPGACATMTVLFGTNVTNGSVTDSVPNNIVDSFGFDVTASATANCAWIFVNGAPSGNIHVGVYDNDTGNKPKNLLAHASIPHPSGGNRWVSAPLDTTVTLTPGQIRWLAVITTGGTLTTPIQSGCPSGAYPLHNDTQVTDLPNPFSVAMTFATCAAPIFLGP